MRPKQFARLILPILFSVTAIPAAATTWAPPSEITCAVGGEKFMHSHYRSFSTWGQRLDGRPIGSSIFPMRRPQCPTNHFVEFKETYSPDEIARLTIVVNSNEFKEAVAANASQSYLLFLQLDLGGFDKYEAAGALLQATWLDVIDTELLRKFVSYTDALPPNSDEFVVLWVKLRAMNAQRQLGNFEDAATRLAQIRANVPSDNIEHNFNRSEFLTYLAIFGRAIRERNGSLNYGLPSNGDPRVAH